MLPPVAVMYQSPLESVSSYGKRLLMERVAVAFDESIPHSPVISPLSMAAACQAPRLMAVSARARFCLEPKREWAWPLWFA